MNLDNLHALIERYEGNLPLIYNTEHDELFKWRAMKTWREEWFKPEEAYATFADRFKAAKREFSLFIDNSRMHPSTGVLNIWEKEPETVEHLFYDVLFGVTDDNPDSAQKRMDLFLEEYEALRQKYFPRHWSYKQDRHSASVFLAMNKPDINYVFKSSEAAMMAKYTDFGLNIGSGGGFRLRNYYELCEKIVSTLKEHQSLLDKHFECLTDSCYYDNSLHLLAFDLMYCCRTYGFYKGLTVSSTGKTIKRKEIEGTGEDPTQKETEKLAKIAALQQEIDDLEKGCENCEDISLVGVQVTSDNEIGTVIGQDINRIKVAFSASEKSFILDKKYTARPRFENDDEIVSMFTDYGRAKEKIRRLQIQLESLLKQ